MSRNRAESPYRQRLQRLRAELVRCDVEAILLTKPANLSYVFGFSGSAGMGLVTPQSSRLYTDYRYAGAAELQLAAADESASLFVGSLADQVQAIRVATRELPRLALEAAHVTYAAVLKFEEQLSPVELVPVEGVVERLRLVKDASELARMRAAAALADAALEDVVASLSSGITEREFARRLDSQMKLLGAEAVSFATIVASGTHAAMPHATPTHKVIEEGDLVIVDFGAVVGGYHSDTTRTFAIGRNPLSEVFDAVLTSNEAGRRAALAGARHSDVWEACWRVLDAAGLADAVLHPMGHNIGLEVHELPYLTQAADEVLVEGQVITVEPACYIPGVGGVRVEDMVVIRGDTSEELTHLARDSAMAVAPPSRHKKPLRPAPDELSDYIDVELLDDHARFLIGDT